MKGLTQVHPISSSQGALIALVGFHGASGLSFYGTLTYGQPTKSGATTMMVEWTPIDEKK